MPPPRSFGRVARLMLLVPLLAGGCGMFQRRPSPAPFPDENFAIGQRYYLAQDYRAAAGRFQDYLVFPLPPADEGKGHYWLGRCLLMMGDASNAAKELDKALLCPPPRELHGLALLARADALRASSRPADAERDYRKIIERDGPHDPIDVAMVRLAQLLSSQGRGAEAQQVLDRFAQRFPESPVPAEGGASAPGGSYSVQVGAYREQKTAEDVVRQLRAKGFDARIDAAGGSYCVRVGRFAARSQAAAEEQRLKQAGFSTYIVK